MDERTLIVTVGTSLFSSASWRNEGAIAGARNYESWLGERYLENPGKRRSRGWRTSAALEKAIREDPEGTAEAFVLDVYKPLRYCGEVTTLLRVFHKEGQGEGEQGFKNFLRRRYPRIHLIASADTENPSHVVARHLRAILHGRLGHPGVEIAAALHGLALTELLGRFGGYLFNLKSQPEGDRVDLLVTGGYKAFSILAGRLVATQEESENWRTLYLHEDPSLTLVIERRAEVDSENQSWETGWPTPVER